jgi:hypothetical protein
MDNLSLEYPCGIRIHQLFLNSIFNHFNNTLLIQEANLQAKNHYTICSNPKIAKNTLHIKHGFCHNIPLFWLDVY